MDQSTVVEQPVSTRPSPFLSFLFGSSFLDRISGIAPWVVALVLVSPRLWLAGPFFMAGMKRYNDFAGGSWDTQLFLFGTEHPLPFVPAGVAATVTMAAELILPVLLALGLLGRVAAFGLAAMTATILLALPEPYSNSTEQLPWILVGFLLFITGPGRLSLDYLIRKLAFPK